MSAAVLCLCAVIAGADARETIPDAAKMYQVLGRAYRLEEVQETLSIDEGLTLQPRRIADVQQRSLLFEIGASAFARDRIGSSFGRGSDRPEVIFALRIVPCPDEPQRLIAGYVMEGPSPEVKFAAFIDTERNLVYRLGGSSNNDKEVNEKEKAWIPSATRLVDDYAKQVAANPQDSMMADYYSLFRRHFVRPPEIEANCDAQLRSLDSMRLTLHLSAEGRQMEKVQDFKLASLLASELSLSAAEYFGGPQSTSEEVKQ
ncbi:hypothetical protein [Blastopirellula marina]|uniref:Uncharacterized protein n=1 Tax=Blastopirellula marina TaxID=124 RepID=A0A2S8GH02_9BACT|nr:hypothetical protein [Blastopirellula marina]PQO43745.1 hypothetical protein C5Y93_24235 [Blastopirellula marina]